MRSIVMLITIVVILCGCGSKEPREPKKADGPEISHTDMKLYWPKGLEEVRLPLSFTKARMPIIACRVNDKPASMGLDTAATLNCVFEHRREYFGLKIVGRGKSAYTGAGLRTPVVGSGHEVGLPKGVRVSASTTTILPEPGPDHYSGDGLIGAAFLRGLNAIIDLERNELIFKNPNYPDRSSEGESEGEE